MYCSDYEVLVQSKAGVRQAELLKAKHLGKSPKTFEGSGWVIVSPLSLSRGKRHCVGFCHDCVLKVGKQSA